MTPRFRTTVAKLRGARERRRREKGKCEGRKSHAEKRPEVVAQAKRLYRASPLTGERRSLRKIAKELAALGHVQREWKAVQRQVRQEHDQGSAACLEPCNIASSVALGAYRYLC